MHDLSERILIVVPCYNEEKRLDISEIDNLGDKYYILFVNDGSSDNTPDILDRVMANNMYVIHLEQNVGKAEAIRLGMNYAMTLPCFENISWVGFWDADFSTPIKEIPFFFAYEKLFEQKVDAIFGSRILKFGSKIDRKHLRHYLGRIFATFTKMLLDLDCYDSQCGSKLFRKEIIEKIFSEKFISKWIFDLEIILRMKNNIIIEYPVARWIEKGGSKVKVFRIAIRTIIELVKIRKKYITKT